MNQQELRTLTRERLKDAKALLGRKRYSFAYHVAGFAVECALKSCVLARMVVTGYVFKVGDGREKKSLKDVFLVHDLKHLIHVAGLQEELGLRIAESRRDNSRFGTFWETVTKWTVEERYVTIEKGTALGLYEAITAKPEGVLAWLTKHW